MTYEEAENWNAVYYRMKQEGFHYCFKHYSSFKEIEDEKFHKWSEPQDQREFDVIILNVFGRPMHVGVVTKNGFMIHCSKDTNTVHEKYTSMSWKGRVKGFGRYEKDNSLHIAATL
jgi:hypothetical protein